MKRLICWLIGHKVQTDPTYYFSYRMGICLRCHKITKPWSIYTGGIETIEPSPTQMRIPLHHGSHDMT